MWERIEELLENSLVLRVLQGVSVAVFALFAIGAVWTLVLSDRSALWLVGTICCENFTQFEGSSLGEAIGKWDTYCINRNRSERK